ncbi:hypothetical protein F25303_12659 [Fusarium sp. NRRL 25303]|nr:hypothetical protein F25303_12659 [Fusarium sp. NRRL 25303]
MCGGTGWGRQSRGDKINSRAFAQAMGSGKPRSPSRFSRKSMRVSHTKVDAKARQLKDTGNQAWDRSFFGSRNGFRKGNSRQRASQGSDASRCGLSGSNGSIRSTLTYQTSTKSWAKPLSQDMLFGNKRKTKVYQPPAKSLRGKLRQAKAGINAMAATASNMAKYGGQVSQSGAKAANNFAQARRRFSQDFKK